MILNMHTLQHEYNTLMKEYIIFPEVSIYAKYIKKDHTDKITPDRILVFVRNDFCEFPYLFFKV